jgi:ribonuclease E
VTSDDEPATSDGDAEPYRAGPANNEPVENVGSGDALEDVQERRRATSRRNQYKIQEVIKRRQVMLVQVVKEERGNKGAALTTYLSLAGRYSVLMPNTARGGGISRKITNAADRKRLKDIVGDLEVPQGQGIILRTAGASAHQGRGEARLRIPAAPVGERAHADAASRRRRASSTRKAR